MKTIVMSIRGRHICNMEAGKKRIELRKRKPAEAPPYRVLLCQSGSGGNIVAEFTCPKVVELTGSDAEIAEAACVTEEEVRGYRADGTLYGWEIEDFHRLRGDDVPHIFDYGVNRAPQSWCYAKRRGKGIA